MQANRTVEGRRALEVVVCLADSVVDVIHVREAGVVVAGTGPGAHIPLPAGVLGEGVETLIVAALDTRGRALALGSLAPDGKMLEIQPNENVSIELGPTRILVRLVADGEVAPAGRTRVERRVVGVLGLSLLAHLVLLEVAHAVPPDRKQIAFNDDARSTRMTSVRLMASEPAVLEPPPAPADAKAPEGGGEQGTMAAPDRSGLFGDPNETHEGGRVAVKGTADRDRPTRSTAGEWVAQKGVLGAIKRAGGLNVPGLQSDWEDLGTSDVYALGPGAEGEPSDGRGAWGGGYDDDGGQGGCRPGLDCGVGSIGRGKIKWPGASPGWSGKPGLASRPPTRSAGVPAPAVGPVRVSDDGLDKAIVRRVIRSHIDEVRYCYERALIANPNLAGNVTIEFTILESGAVLEVRIVSASVGDEVAQCVAARTKTWTFPRSGSMTHVRYPFDFRAAGK